MPRNVRRVSPIIALLFCTAIPAAAEPISLVYRVDVFQKLDFTRPVSEWQCEAIAPVTFTYSVSFDSAVSSQRVSQEPDERYAFTYFGTPSVSDVPLSGAGYTGGLHIAQTYVVNATVHGALHQEALTLDQFSDDRGTRSVQLYKRSLDPALPPGEFGDLAAFLGAMRSPSLEFYFADLAYGRDEHGNVTYLPGSASYFGSVSLLDNTPVPEPATMTMFAFGLAAATLRRRRTRNCARH
jgi:hypothetical protein